jgi:hypothetical protein
MTEVSKTVQMVLLFYTIGGLSLIKSFFTVMSNRFEGPEVIQVGEQKRCPSQWERHLRCERSTGEKNGLNPINA